MARQRDGEACDEVVQYDRGRGRSKPDWDEMKCSGWDVTFGVEL